MKEKLWIRSLQGYEETVKLPTRFKHLQLKKLSFGARACTLQFEYDSTLKDDILISEDMMKLLSIPHDRQLHVFVHSDVLDIGPLIGIFTAGFTESLLRPIGERSLFFAKFLTMEKSIGVNAFVFGAHLINWSEGTVEGYFYDEKQGWSKRMVPLPHVIYDRLPNRKTENHAAIQKIKQRLKDEYLIPWYNPGFFNKWEIFKSLQTEGSMKHYLPETIYQPTFLDIQRMIDQHKHIYIKPANGSLGLGIYQVIASSTDHAYYCRYRDGEENRLQKFTSLKKLIQHLFKGKSLQNYLVQQGIHLIRYESRPVDFRIHTNKDQDGKWRVTAIAGKVAGKGSVTTHLNNGGMIKTLEELFPEQKKRESLSTRMHHSVLLLSKAISASTEGIVGEIGFDIGLDKNGDIWLFEANSKPGRAIFSHPKLKMADRLSRQLSMAYAIYLTEQGVDQLEAQYQ
ncbi:YheC/YheD family protein [Bacillus salitolerans]|uniref:YheC/YheD family protein n=1 Tax=Bacillus salitolerans TaxID=1437434 RepID=A0ABW4LXE0_9BACI